MSKDKVFPRLGRWLVCLALLMVIAPAAMFTVPTGSALAQFDVMALDGHVFINGAAAPLGTPVSAMRDGVEVGSCTTGGEGLDDNFYAMAIYGEAGDQIELYVHGIEAAESPYAWNYGVRHRNLSINKAHLVVNITTPLGGETYSTEQQFTVTATVTNTGLADATGVDVTIDIDQGAVVVNPGVIQNIGAIAAGATSAEVTWTLECTASGQTTITVRPSGQTPDNNGGFVDVPDNNLEPNQVVVNQEAKAHLEVTEVSSNLTGDTASTLQTFTVSATVINMGEAVANNVTAALTITGGTGTATILSGPDPADVAALAENETQEFTWEVQCTGSGSVEFLVTPSGTDENTGEAVLTENIETLTLTINQEEKSHFNADITAPADGDTVAVGTEFQVDADICNTGEAGVLGAGATITIDGPAELQAGETAAKDCGDLGGGACTTSPLSWLLVCTGEGDVTITVTPYGTDENTGESVLAGNIEPDSITVTQQLAGIEYTLTMAVNGQGTTTPAVGAQTHPAGTVVDITAEPAENWEFVDWTGDVADPNNPVTTVTMDADKEVTANFQATPEADITYTILLAADWNYISIPLVPVDDDVDAVFDSITGEYIEVWGYDACTEMWQTYAPGQPDAYYEALAEFGIGKLENIEDGYGYILRMSQASTLTGIGLEYQVGATLPPTYPICGSWNLVGFKTMDFNDDVQITQASDAMRVDYYLQTLDWNLNDAVIADEVAYLWYYDTATGEFAELTNNDDMLVGYAFWLYLVAIENAEIVPPIAQEGI